MELADLFDLLTRAYKSGNWYFILSAALVAVVWGVRRYLTPRFPVLKSDWAAVTLTFAMAFFGAVATALGAGTPFSVVLVVAAFKIAFTAMGGYTALRKFILPLLGKVPGFGGTAAKVEALKAGVEAVQARPGAGAAGVVGKPKELK